MYDPDHQSIPKVDESARPPAVRYAYMAVGFFFVALATIGVFLPVLPTTPFLIVAMWAFSKSSQRFHDWLYTHRVFGPYLVDWSKHRVIPAAAKFLAIIFMAGGWVVFTLYVATSWVWPAVIGICEIGVAIYILSKPSKAPTEAD